MRTSTENRLSGWLTCYFLLNKHVKFFSFVHPLNKVFLQLLRLEIKDELSQKTPAVKIKAFLVSFFSHSPGWCLNLCISFTQIQRTIAWIPRGKGSVRGIGRLELIYIYMLSLFSFFCDPMDYSQPGSSVHGISQARILKWVAISFSKGSS